MLDRDDEELQDGDLRLEISWSGAWRLHAYGSPILKEGPVLTLSPGKPEYCTLMGTRPMGRSLSMHDSVLSKLLGTELTTSWPSMYMAAAESKRRQILACRHRYVNDGGGLGHMQALITHKMLT